MRLCLRREWVTLVTLALGIACSVWSAQAVAQAWPAKPVRVIVPFAPGGSADTLGRLVAQKLSESFHQTFVVENRAGAGGVIGSELVAKALPDGYTLLVSGVASHCIAPALARDFPFDPLRDFTHIALFGGPPGVLVVYPGVAARDFKEFIVLLKAQPGKMSYGSPGNGTQGHLLGEHLKQLAGIEMTHVPYKGAGPAVADMIAGHVAAGSTTLTTAATQIRAGKLRALAVTGATRSAAMPDIPTVSESGVAGYEVTPWFGVLAPTGIPAEVVRTLDETSRKIFATTILRERVRAMGADPADEGPDAFRALIRTETQKWATVAKKANIRAD